MITDSPDVSRGVVHPIAGHAHDMATFLQDIYDVELVLGEYLGEAVRFLDGLGQLRGLVLLGVAKATRIEDVCAQSKFRGGFSSDGHLIASNHLDAYPHLAGGRDGRLGFFPGRVEKRQHAEKPPWALPVRASHTERAEAARRKLVDGFLDGALHLPGIGRQLQDHLRRL